MSSPFVGQIIVFGGNFTPVGYFPCNGSLLPIAQYQALFSLIGTTYGGDGVTTFALPNLQGRLPIGQGTGPGLSNRPIGEAGGAETTTLSTAHLPPHSHAIDATGTTAALACKLAAGNTASPVGAVPAIEAAGVTLPYASSAPTVAMGGAIAPGTNALSGNAGSGAAHGNMQPYLVLNYCIAFNGIFPTQ